MSESLVFRFLKELRSEICDRSFHAPISIPQVASDDNDGVRLFETLLRIHSPEDVAQLLGTIEGPYAFAFYHVSL